MLDYEMCETVMANSNRTGPSLVGPLDLSNITLDRLPEILTRFADKIEAIDSSLMSTINENKQGHDNILKAIETMKITNSDVIEDFRHDVDNIKTIVKVFRFVSDHPWLSGLVTTAGFVILDYLTRYTYWKVWPG